MTPLPLTRDLVLVGGGHAHALVLKMWGMKPLAGARLTIINPGPVVPYTGMLPGYIAGHYSRDEIMIDLVRLARHAGARLLLNSAIGLDRDAGHVLLDDGQRVPYDVLSIDVGITSDPTGIDGFTEHGVAAKPLGAYAERWETFVASGPVRPRIAVIGAGIGGVELALASAHRLRRAALDPVVTLLERREGALHGMRSAARSALLAHVETSGIGLITGAEPVRIGPDAIQLSDGRKVLSDFTVAAAGAKPHGWLSALGLDHRGGFPTVSDTLQTSDPAIFAAGDCAEMTFSRRPKAGVFAVRQAPVLLANLKAALSGRPMTPFRPQSDYLKLVSLGGRSALADKWGLRASGAMVWRLKDRIDRSFMDRLADLPAMRPLDQPRDQSLGMQEALGEKPLCGGCGAKVGATELSAALAGLQPPRRPEVVSGPGDDAAVLKTAQGFQVLSTDHLRAFTEDPALMSRIAAIHALGDIWSMGAMPQTALAQIILPRMSQRMQSETLREIMSAAERVFTAAGADIVGGHTSVGAELTVGFSVTGTASAIVEKGRAQAGDALILTKPLGTGTILSADMANPRLTDMLLGEAVSAAWKSMAMSSAAASQILTDHAHAMTDVTGFGLAGHLLEMLDSSGCGAVLDGQTIPLIPGALALAGAGHASSLAPANRRVAGRMRVADTPRNALLFDPQTAGGLLAAIPAERAEKLLVQLRDAGYDAAIIGAVTAGPAFVVVE